MSTRMVSENEAQNLLDAATPGPWTVWEGHFDVFSDVSENTRGSIMGEQLCELSAFRESSYDPDPQTTDCGCEDDGCAVCFPVKAADVQLIAAAPDLAATVVTLYEREGHYAETLKGANERIATLEAEVREVCARVCDNQARMLDAVGDRDGATAARLCASVLRALTPPASIPSSDVPKSEVLSPVPPAVCPPPTEGA